MKNLLPFLLLFISCSAAAQSARRARKEFMQDQIKDSIKLTTDTAYLNGKGNCHCSILPPFTLVGKSLVRRRYNHFALKMGRTKQQLEPGMEYSPKGVEALLDTVVTKVGTSFKYSGFRAYFAVFPEKMATPPDCKSYTDMSIDSGYCYVSDGYYGKLTLIFVPTTQDPDTTEKHPDDTSCYMIINADTVSIIPRAVVQQWVAKAQQGVLQTFETEGRGHMFLHKFRETHSLWYSRYAVEPHHILKNGLLDVIHCQLCAHDITGVHAGYAAFLGPFHAYKLTLVFTLINGSRQENFTMKAAGVSDNGSDTGNPCPPPSKCSTVGDAISQ